MSELYIKAKKNRFFHCEMEYYYYICPQNNTNPKENRGK